MQLYKIEKGIPVAKPATATSDGRPSKTSATMQAMAKGDSFLITGSLDALKAPKIVRDFNGRERRRGEKPRVFVTRKMSDGVRIWRAK